MAVAVSRHEAVVADATTAHRGMGQAAAAVAPHDGASGSKAMARPETAMAGCAWQRARARETNTVTPSTRAR